MSSDLRSWLFQSPRRLILVIGGPLLVAVILGSAWSANRNGPSTDTASSGRPTAQVPDAQPFVTAAVDFVWVWGHLDPGESERDWHRAVNERATTELATALDLTDPKALPNARPLGTPTVKALTSTSTLVLVPLDSGSSVLVTVVADDDNTWLVQDIQPNTGN
jgi:hypothetical protein